MKTIKKLFKIGDSVFPSLTAKTVYKAMSNPRIHKLRTFEEDILAQSVQQRIPFKKFEIQTYTWGNPNDKTILFVHGWEGQAGNFGALVSILLEKRYFVVAYDAPSHGKSSKQNTSMFEFIDLADVLFKKYRPQSVISHSFGSVTTLMTLSKNSEIPIDQWFLVTTPHDFKNVINEVKNMLGLTHRTMDKVIHKIETENNLSIDHLNMAHYGQKIPHVKEVVIIHSKSDKIIPIQSARIAHQSIPQSALIELDNLGHYRILWSDELKDIITNRIR